MFTSEGGTGGPRQGLPERGGGASESRSLVLIITCPGGQIRHSQKVEFSREKMCERETERMLLIGVSHTLLGPPRCTCRGQPWIQEIPLDHQSEAHAQYGAGFRRK